MGYEEDWRLLNETEHLRGRELNPTDGEELSLHAPRLKICAFCWDPVCNDPRQWWYITTDLSDCVCQRCFQDFRADFGWKLLDGWDIDWSPAEES